MTIYQVLPRLFGNGLTCRVPGGTREQNGCGTLADFSGKVLDEIRGMGVTHVWFTGLIEHATQTDYSAYGIAADCPDVVKGKAGSPYAIKDYYDIAPDLATRVPQRMREMESLVRRTHQAGLGFIMDFVPNHVARQYHSDSCPKGTEDLGEGDDRTVAFSPRNNFYYLPGEPLHLENITGGRARYSEFPARATGNDCFSAWPSGSDWYETVKLNYGVDYQNGFRRHFTPRPPTWDKMLAILLFWASKGVDAFRCDMAEMVPVEFWQWAIARVKGLYPDLLFIAEVYNPALYREYVHQGGFDYLYDKVGMYDYLRGVTSKNWPVEGITQQWQRVDDIREHMLYFLENHDEQRIASGFFCGRGMCAEPAMIVAATLGTNPVMVYAGQELGEKGMDAEGFSGMDGKSSIFDYWGIASLQAWANHGKFDGALLDDEQRDLRAFYRQLLRVARTEKAITMGEMYDLEYAQGEGFNKHEQFAYIRKYKRQMLLVVLNFDDRQVDMQVRVPKEAFEHLELSEQSMVEATDLLTGATYRFPLTAHTPVCLTLPAWKGVILKVKTTK
ncbi:MAG TPA: alpha-amylase [Prevotellaceae bacterium]|nr:alpha-amylase [Prevotellaceae bacterium]